MIADIMVENVDVNLLRKQYQALVNLMDTVSNDELNGLVNLLETMLDIAEGHR